MKIYKHNKQILSIVYKDEDWVKGLNFITPEDMYIQVGSWWYQKGKTLDSHVHNDFERETIDLSCNACSRSGVQKEAGSCFDSLYPRQGSNRIGRRIDVTALRCQRR